MSARLAALASRAVLDLAYLSIGLATAILALVVWTTAVPVTLSLLVLVVGLPLFLLSALAFRWTAELDRRNAVLALGRPLRASYRDHSGEGFFARLGSTAGDPQTWRDLAWLVVHSVVGLAFGAAALALAAQAVAGLFLPAWYWAVPGGVDLGALRADSLAEAFLGTLLAIPLTAIAVLALRGLTIAHSWLAVELIGGGEGEAAAAPEPGAAPGAAPRGSRPRIGSGTWLFAGLAVAGLLAALVTAIWAATGAGYFWPAWVWLALAIPISLGFGVREAVRAAPDHRALAVQAAISAEIVAIEIVVWALAGFGSFWPIWTLLALLTAFALHLLGRLTWDRVYAGERERELSARVETLTKTRRGALDVQSAELRRIERDLHDGAQARLVALSMQLGRAEQGLADNPEAAELVRAARSEAGAAIAELRDLARGIAPPVLADRGLPAAVEALGRRSPVPVTLTVALERRPPAVIETAAYFVVAEALTNVAKHAPDAAATVAIGGGIESLRVEVADDGPGGADPTGGGLEGLRARVAALDGELLVTSPRGAGTTIEAELPCGS